MNIDDLNAYNDQDSNVRLIEDDLDKENIRQLHSAVLNFSNQSTEIKKLCITVEIAALTLIFNIFENKYASKNFIFILCFTAITITLLFYLVDVSTYYYQDKLRFTMLEIENNIRRKNNITETTIQRSNEFFDRLKRSLFNGSNLIYYILVAIPLLVITILIIHYIFMR